MKPDVLAAIDIVRAQMWRFAQDARRLLDHIADLQTQLDRVEQELLRVKATIETGDA